MKPQCPYLQSLEREKPKELEITPELLADVYLLGNRYGQGKGIWLNIEVWIYLEDLLKKELLTPFAKMVKQAETDKSVYEKFEKALSKIYTAVIGIAKQAYKQNRTLKFHSEFAYRTKDISLKDFLYDGYDENPYLENNEVLTDDIDVHTKNYNKSKEADVKEFEKKLKEDEDIWFQLQIFLKKYGQEYDQAFIDAFKKKRQKTEEK